MTVTYIAAAEIARTALKNLTKALIDDDLPYEARAMVLTLENVQDLIYEGRRKLGEEANRILRVPFPAGVASSSGHFAAGAMHAGDISVEEGIDVGQREDTLKEPVTLLDVDYKPDHDAWKKAEAEMLRKAQSLPSRTGASGGSGYENPLTKGFPDGD